MPVTRSVGRGGLFEAFVGFVFIWVLCFFSFDGFDFCCFLNGVYNKYFSWLLMVLNGC